MPLYSRPPTAYALQRGVGPGIAGGQDPARVAALESWQAANPGQGAWVNPQTGTIGATSSAMVAPGTMLPGGGVAPTPFSGPDVSSLMGAPTGSSLPATRTYGAPPAAAATRNAQVLRLLQNPRVLNLLLQMMARRSGASSLDQLLS